MEAAKKKPMTMDKLAEIVAGGFAAVDARFDHMEQKNEERFVMIDKRFDAMDKRMDKIENILMASYQNQLDQLRDTVLQLVAYVKMPSKGKMEK